MLQSGVSEDELIKQGIAKSSITKAKKQLLTLTPEAEQPLPDNNPYIGLALKLKTNSDNIFMKYWLESQQLFDSYIKEIMKINVQLPEQEKPKKTPKPTPKLDPVDFCRRYSKEELKSKLDEFEIDELLVIARKYMPDPTKKIYRTKDKAFIINHIAERAQSLATHGDVFRKEL